MKNVMLVCFVMVLGLAGMGSAAMLSDNFEDGNYTANPTWNVLTDTWEVVQEPFGLTGVNDNQYLRMANTTATDDDGQIYATGSPAITTGKFELKMRLKPENTGLSSNNYQRAYIGQYNNAWLVNRQYQNSYYFQVINRNTGSEVTISKWKSTGTDRVTLATANAYSFDGSWVDVKFTYDKSLTTNNLKLYIGDMQAPFLTATDDGTNEPRLTTFDSVVLYTRSADGYQWGIDDVSVVPDASKMAQNPNPADHAFVAPSLTSLSWINPDPNAPSNSIICNVYLSKSSDFSTYDVKTLGSNVNTVSINTTNFSTYGNLADGNYYWRVDCKDTGTNVTTEGYKWAFYVVSGANACVASHLTGSPYDDGDINEDCRVNLSDLAILAADWLLCTDTLTNCAN